MKSSPEEHILKSLASRNSGTGKMGLLSRYGKITGHMNKPAYSNDLSVEGGGHTNVEKLVNRTDETYYRKSVDVHETFTKNSALLQNSAVVNLGPAKNHPVHAFDLNPLTTPSGSPHFEASMGRHYNGNHLAHSHGIHLEKNFDASFCNPMPRFTGVMNHDSRACRPNFSNKTFQDTLSNASNTELKLGQSSYHQSMTTLSPLGQSTMIEFQKPQTHRPPINQSELAFCTLFLSLFSLCIVIQRYSFVSASHAKTLKCQIERPQLETVKYFLLIYVNFLYDLEHHSRNV
ncbi:Histone-lysine N-methyltransferase ATX4 [Zea mays]|jgi:hypothetical protein|uniref:Histone-lysine N-methyltransferase ATX4 n=1 Tax=Zea mays TaxID=4577 RepID=A0A1D6EUY4_MAIZE|nr:Histone-lysine N-methyltransferase ATX4 [Zea mays]